MVEAVWMRLETDADTGSTFLVWNPEIRHDYPLSFGNDLSTWFAVGNTLSMNNSVGSRLNVSSLVGDGTTFFAMPSVDYSHTPVLPFDIFGLGDTVEMETPHGTLTVVFDGSGGGTWSFEETGGSTTNGTVTNTYVPGGTRLPGIPLSGLYFKNGGSYARGLSAREVVIEFNQPLGPYGFTLFQPSFSFHSATTGWYSVPFQNNVTGSVSMAGTFTWTPGP